LDQHQVMTWFGSPRTQIAKSVSFGCVDAVHGPPSARGEFWASGSAGWIRKQIAKSALPLSEAGACPRAPAGGLAGMRVTPEKRLNSNLGVGDRPLWGDRDPKGRNGVRNYKRATGQSVENQERKKSDT